jgi:hypothetical protein
MTIISDQNATEVNHAHNRSTFQRRYSSQGAPILCLGVSAVRTMKSNHRNASRLESCIQGIAVENAVVNKADRIA